MTTSEQTLIRCIGKMTYTSSEALRSTVRGLLTETKRLVSDLKDVTYLDSFGLGVLVSIYFVRQTAGLPTEAHQCEPTGGATLANYERDLSH